MRRKEAAYVAYAFSNPAGSVTVASFQALKTSALITGSRNPTMIDMHTGIRQVFLDSRAFFKQILVGLKWLGFCRAYTYSSYT